VPFTILLSTALLKLQYSAERNIIRSLSELMSSWCPHPTCLLSEHTFNYIQFYTINYFVVIILRLTLVNCFSQLKFSHKNTYENSKVKFYRLNNSQPFCLSFSMGKFSRSVGHPYTYLFPETSKVSMCQMLNLQIYWSAERTLACYLYFLSRMCQTITTNFSGM